MAAEIVIIWPDPRWAGLLHSALLRGNLKAPVQLLLRYPEASELVELLRDGDGESRVVIVGLTDLTRATKLFQTAKESLPHIHLIAADIAESTAGLKAAMRAGAADYWTPPFDPAEIARNLSSVTYAHGESGVLLACLPGQPGDGASTAALHLAQSISVNRGEPALLIDCDVQCGTLGFRLGLNPEYTLLDAAGHASNLDEIWDRIATRWRDIRVLASPESSFGLTGEHLEALPSIVESALRRFPYVVADLPAALYSPCAGVLRRADKVCVVCTPEITSLHLTRRRFTDLREWDVRADKVKLVVNRADARNAPMRQEIARSLGVPVAWSLPNCYQELSKATLDGGVVERDSAYGQAIQQMAAGLADFEAAAERGSSWRKLLSFG